MNLKSVPPHVTQVSKLLSWGIAIINRRMCWYPAQIGADTRAFSHQLTLVLKWKVSARWMTKERGARMPWCARIAEWTRFWAFQYRRRGSSVRSTWRMIDEHSWIVNVVYIICACTNVSDNPAIIISMIDELIDISRVNKW